jgi:hypothetical protein
MRGAIPPLPKYAPWRGAQLKHRDDFTFTSCYGQTQIMTCSLRFYFMIFVEEYADQNSYFFAI